MLYETVRFVLCACILSQTKKHFKFSLPDFGLTNKDTIIEESVWEKVKNELIAEHETWGMVELGYRAPNEYESQFEEDKVKKGKKGKIKLTAFKNFCPYTIDLD